MSDPGRSKATVLIIDDSTLVLEFLTVVLEDEGWEGHTRTTPVLDAKGIAAIAPNVVLLDLGIPGVTDADLPFVVSTLRKHGATKVLFHSGRGAGELSALADLAGADGYVCKAAGDDDSLIERLESFKP